MTQYTIAGQNFDIPVRYEEGHVMNVHEAREANRHLASKLQIGMTKKIKTKMTNGKLAKTDHEALQKELYDRATNYEAGTRYRDPAQKRAKLVTKEAEKIAKSMMPRKQRHDKEAVKAKIASDPMISELAEKQITQ
jgi:hypothetical protein